MTTTVMISCNPCLFVQTRPFCVFFGWYCRANECTEKSRRGGELGNDALEDTTGSLLYHFSAAPIQRL